MGQAFRKVLKDIIRYEFSKKPKDEPFTLEVATLSRHVGLDYIMMSNICKNEFITVTSYRLHDDICWHIAWDYNALYIFSFGTFIRGYKNGNTYFGSPRTIFGMSHETIDDLPLAERRLLKYGIKSSEKIIEDILEYVPDVYDRTLFSKRPSKLCDVSFIFFAVIEQN